MGYRKYHTLAFTGLPYNVLSPSKAQAHWPTRHPIVH